MYALELLGTPGKQKIILGKLEATGAALSS